MARQTTKSTKIQSSARRKVWGGVPGITPVPAGKPRVPGRPPAPTGKPPAPGKPPGGPKPYYYGDYGSDEVVSLILKKYCAVELLNALIIALGIVPPPGKGKGKGGKGGKGGGGGGGYPYGGTPPAPGRPPAPTGKPPAPGRPPAGKPPGGKPLGGSKKGFFRSR